MIAGLPQKGESFAVTFRVSDNRQRRAWASRIARGGRTAALTIGSSMSVSPISGLMFLLLAAGAARAEDPSGDKGLTTYAIAMHGQPALPADFSRLPYADPQATKGGHLALAYQGTFDSLNPYNLSAGSTAQGLIGNVFQSLMLRSLDEPFTLYGLIAQSIETDDARSYVIFRLDPRARFSDGVPVSAADVLFTFDLLKQKGRPQQRDAFGRVKRAEALDLMTVRFDLSGLDSEMPLTLAMMPVLPKHGTDVEHFDNPTLKPPVGTGPYVIADVQPGERLILRRNPDYWAQDLPVQRGLFNFDEIEIDYYRDADSSFEAFKAGLCDFRQETDAGRWISSYDFPAVRDGRAVILEGRSEPPITDGSGRDRTMARRALALLGEAGYAIKSGVLVERTSGRPFAFEILVQSSTQERLSRIYADGLRRIGIYATVRLVDELQYERRRQKFDFDMLIAAWIATPSPGYGQRFLWGSQSADQEASYNLAGARSPAIDAMIAAMVAAKTHEDFDDAVRAYDRVLLSGFYIVPLFYAREQWIAYSNKLAHPKYIPLFGVTIDNWWQKQP
jgi:ABC-type oligopeptide transport system substrate-binding subunit